MDDPPKPIMEEEKDDEPQGDPIEFSISQFYDDPEDEEKAAHLVK